MFKDSTHCGEKKTNVKLHSQKSIFFTSLHLHVDFTDQNRAMLHDSFLYFIYRNKITQNMHIQNVIARNKWNRREPNLWNLRQLKTYKLFWWRNLTFTTPLNERNKQRQCTCSAQLSKCHPGKTQSPRGLLKANQNKTLCKTWKIHLFSKVNY